MACYLIISLSAVACLFFLAGADFVGAMQLMVYVGGTLVLLVFGVMLTAQGPHDTLYTGGGQWILAIAAGGSLLAILIQAAFSVSDWSANQPPQNQVIVSQTADVTAMDSLGNTATPLGMGMLGIRTDSLEEKNTTIRDGMSGYLLPFEIISVHLLVVLIGAAYLARTKRRE
jgi:NADH:ubiquinone oxidoreductase subunit 6 (subunit J)